MLTTLDGLPETVETEALARPEPTVDAEVSRPLYAVLYTAASLGNASIKLACRLLSPLPKGTNGYPSDYTSDPLQKRRVDSHYLDHLPDNWFKESQR